MHSRCSGTPEFRSVAVIIFDSASSDSPVASVHRLASVVRHGKDDPIPVLSLCYELDVLLALFEKPRWRIAFRVDLPRSEC